MPAPSKPISADSSRRWFLSVKSRLRHLRSPRSSLLPIDHHHPREWSHDNHGTPLHPSGITEVTATELNEILQQRLVSLVDLRLTLKHIHWNVVGPGFMAVHEMLDDHVEGTRAAADEVAERIATLGGIPNGLPGFLTTARTWDDCSLGRGVVEAHLGALDKVYDGVIADHRAAAEAAVKVDPVTEDMLIAQTGKLELYQWFVRAHIENTSGELMSGDARTEIEAAAAAATASPMAKRSHSRSLSPSPSHTRRRFEACVIGHPSAGDRSA